VIEDTLRQAESKMHKAIEVAKEEFSGIRTGRANPALVNRLQVDYYGTPTPLQQLAGISAPEARLLVVGEGSLADELHGQAEALDLLGQPCEGERCVGTRHARPGAKVVVTGRSA